MKRSQIFVLAMLVIGLGYEAFTLSNDVPNDTISEAMWAIFSGYPIFAFLLGNLLGILAGHFWWPLNSDAVKARNKGASIGRKF